MYPRKMGKSLRICYLTFDSLSEGVGQSQILPLVRGISDMGHEVSLITFEKKLDEKLVEQMREGEIAWQMLPFGKFGIKGLFKRIVSMANVIPEADVYHCRSDLPLIPLALRKKGPILWDVRSLWFEQKIIIDGLRSFGLMHFISRKIERYASRNTQAINVLASPLLNVIEKRNGVIPNIKTVIPTCVDLERFGFEPNQNEEERILLSGTLNKFYDIEKTKEVISAFFNQGFSIEWARGAESTRQDFSTIPIDIKTVKHADMPKQIAGSTFGIAICRTDCADVLKGVMPTKIAEFLAVGRPVIISSGMGDLDNLISEYEAGIVLQENISMSDLISKARALSSDPDTSLRCRKLAEDHFSMRKAIKDYERTYMAIAELMCK